MPHREKKDFCPMDSQKGQGFISLISAGTRPHRYPYDYCPQLKKMPIPEQ
jgi:hypothetical protein